ncbi:adhesion G-protein coupled receptor G4 isoform X1 [Anguilla rostrata]|uniref:adhesion G-protein coupled receptor G4 isoform X1 n=2 Tax=Anguilla rostrata TaxID=7938 RepID=UPI0030CD40A2
MTELIDEVMETFRKCSYIIISAWMMKCMCLQDSGTSSLWGNKVDFMKPRCTFWQLNPGCVVPALEELSVCVRLWRQNDSPSWTVFVYKLRGEKDTELGLMGTARSLQVCLFGQEWSAPHVLPLQAWHTVCLTWSRDSRHLRLHVNGSQVFIAKVHGQKRSLSPGGILTLGVSHSFTGREIELETGTDFQGALSLFRMWGTDRHDEKLSDVSCVEGDVVRWSARDWNASGCQPVPDAGLKCAWSFFEIRVTVSITRWDGNTTNIPAAKVIVNIWLREILPSHMSIVSVSVSLSGQVYSRGSLDLTYREEGQERRESGLSPVQTRFDCIMHVRVIPNADVREVQTEVFRLLSTQHDSSVITTETSSIIILPVEAYPSPTDLPPLTVAPSSTVEAATQSSPTSTMPPESQPSSSGPHIIGSTHASPSITQEPNLGLRVTFYRVNLNVTVSSGDAYDPGEIIQIWLLTTLPGDHMSVLNFKLLRRTNSQLEFKNPEVEKTATLARMNSYGCTFQVQVNTSLDVAQTEQQIRDLLKPDFICGPITVHAESIQISQIEPGTCPEHSQQTRQGFYVWPETKAQHKATLPCEGDRSQTASRHCKLDALTERAKWTVPDLRLCPFIVISILDLDHIAVTQNNSEDVVDMILNLTCEHTALSHPEVDIILNKLSEILEVSPVTPSLGEAMVHVIANILESDTNLSHVTNQILKITEDIGDRISFSGESYNIIEQPLAISLVNVDPDRFDGITFGVSSALQDLEIFINEDPIKSTVAFISLPREVESRFPQQTETSLRIQFHFYSAVQLFQDTQSEKELNTYVVSASVTNATISNLEQQVVVTLRHLKPVRHEDEVECVFWNFSKNGVGGWDPSGCSKRNTSVDYTTCVCDHLTHFGVLLDVSRTGVSKENEKILSIISYLGCGISSIFLGVSLLTYTVFEKLRRDYPSKILINLSLALLGLNLVFLLDSWLSSFHSHGLCISTAAFLHYFLLASFTWMGLEAVHMYFALVKVFNVYVPSYILKFCVLGWGIPLVVVSLILAVKMDAYGSSVHGKALKPLESSELFCWVQDDVVFYVSVVAYIFLVLLCNAAVFVVVLVQIHNMQANKPAGSRRGLLHELRGVASLTFLLGLTWILAFFAWEPAKVPLLYLFCLLNSLQGFFIFVFHCLMKENVRKQWRAHLCCGPFKPKEHSDWSQTATVVAKSRLNHLVHTPSVKSARSDNSNSTSNSSVSAQRLISTRRTHTELVYEKPLALPRARCSTPPVPPECTFFPGEMDRGIPSWPPRDRLH